MTDLQINLCIFQRAFQFLPDTLVLTSSLSKLFIAVRSPNLVHQHWGDKETPKCPNHFDWDCSSLWRIATIFYQVEVVCQFTANSPAANSTGWSCLPIRFKREILTFFIRTSKRTVTFALNKPSIPFSCSKWWIFVAWHRNSGVFYLHFNLVWYKVCYRRGA